MTKLTNNDFFKSYPTHYDVLSDYVHENHSQVPITGTTPEVLLDVNLDDCYLDEEGNFFAPDFYNWSYKGSDEFTDPDEYSPIYNPSTPTLTKLQVANLVALADEPELNDPSRNL